MLFLALSFNCFLYLLVKKNSSCKSNLKIIQENFLKIFIFFFKYAIFLQFFIFIKSEMPSSNYCGGLLHLFSISFVC